MEKSGKKRERVRLFRYIEYLIVLGLVKAISILTYKRASDIGGLLGRSLYFLDARHRHVTLKNLKRAFPAEDEKRITFIAKGSFENLGRSAAEFIYIATRKAPFLPKAMHDWIAADGINNLTKVQEKGKGILFLSAHLGNWELLGITMAANGYPLNVIARPLDNPRIDKLLTSLRGITGGRVIPKKKGLRDILKGLKNGEGIGILIDQNTTRDEGVFVDFFGYPAATTRGPALIAMKSGTPVIPLFIIREGTYRHRIICGPEIPLHKSGEVERDVFVNTEGFTKVIESYIREYPEQWLWMHQRWKTKKYYG